MKAKYILGLILPLLIVIVLIILSSVNIGLEVKTEAAKSVSMNQLSNNQYVNLLNITVANNYFLPRSYALPEIVACLYNPSSSYGANLPVAYSTYSVSKIEPGIDKVLYPDIEPNYYYTYEKSKKGIDIPAANKKIIGVVTSSRAYSVNSYSQILLFLNETIGNDNYYGYDYYSFCSKMTPDKLEMAVKIDLINDLYVPTYQQTYQPTVTKKYCGDGICDETDKFCDTDCPIANGTILILYENVKVAYEDWDITATYFYPTSAMISIYPGNQDKLASSTMPEINQTITIYDTSLRFKVLNISYSRESSQRYATIKIGKTITKPVTDTQSCSENSFSCCDYKLCKKYTCNVLCPMNNASIFTLYEKQKTGYGDWDIEAQGIYPNSALIFIYPGGQNIYASSGTIYEGKTNFNYERFNMQYTLKELHYSRNPSERYIKLAIKPIS